MYGRKPKQASMKGMKHGICKAKMEGYTTPTKTKHEMALPTKSKLHHGKITPKNTLK